MPCKKKYLLLSTLLFFFFFSRSQTDTIPQVDSLAGLSLEELMNIPVYTASKKLEKASDAPAIVSVITRQDIEKMGVTSLIDVLKYTPGVETSMGGDGNYRLSNRGARKDGNILVLINGQPMNDFYNGKPIYDLPADFVEKIEIVRGPGSALFGSNAVVAIINIFTIKNSGITANVGTNSTFSGNINYHLQKEKIEFAVSAGYIQSNGANTVIETDAKDRPGNTWDLTYGDNNYKTRRWNKDAYLNSTINSGNLRFNVFCVSRNRGTWAGPLFVAAPDSRIQTNQVLSSLSYDFKVNEVVVITPKIYSNVILNDNLSQETPGNYVSSVIPGQIFSDGKQMREKYAAMTIGGEVDLNIKVNEHFSLLTGNVIENLSLPQYELTRNYKIVGDEYKSAFGNYDSIPYTQKNKHRYIFAYYVQGCYKWKKINVTAGIRYDSYSDFGQSFNPRVGITYSATKQFRLKGLYGRAFRAPTFLELYDNTTIGNEYGIKGNELLKPEIIQTFELGSEYSYKKIILRYNVFYNLNKNLIRDYDTHGTGSEGIYENIGNAFTYGHEAEVVFMLSTKFSFFANYSQFQSEFRWDESNPELRKADFNFFNKQSQCNKLLKNIPSVRLNGGLNFSHKKFNVFAGLNYGGNARNNNRFYLEEDKFVKIPAYIQGNFNITYPVTGKLKVKIAANNIGKKYADPDESSNIGAFGPQGLIQPKETFLIGFTYKY